jgi:hypothetical protein
MVDANEKKQSCDMRAALCPLHDHLECRVMRVESDQWKTVAAVREMHELMDRRLTNFSEALAEHGRLLGNIIEMLKKSGVDRKTCPIQEKKGRKKAS